ncbi:MAG: hypothetical protein M0036_18910 [Desulfobacteraceae bacterium]|nr:hypothetical protein [Desulfobacteraceae bacterium]
MEFAKTHNLKLRTYDAYNPDLFFEDGHPGGDHLVGKHRLQKVVPAMAIRLILLRGRNGTVEGSHRFGERVPCAHFKQSAKEAVKNMSSGGKSTWTFRARFRRHAFGWRSQPAIARIKEAVAEIKKAARKDPLLGGEGAVLLLEKISPAIEHVDSSSGAIGTAVNNAIEALVPIIANAPGDDKLRDDWLKRLWQAVQADGIPYIEILSDNWGDLCASAPCASRWADQFIDGVRMSWGPNPELQGYYKGTVACLSALHKAGRNEEILQLLQLAPYKSWHYRQWGVKALLAMGKKGDALSFAEDSRGLNQSDALISEACEEILLSSGLSEQAYSRYAIDANWKTTYLATFNAMAKKYPHKKPEDILKDLAASSPGEEGKWFAAAKSAGLYDLAIELANESPCDPRTLTRAAKEMVEKQPRFALEAGMAALRWLVQGYGYEVTSMDVWQAYEWTVKAAEHAGCMSEALQRLRDLMAEEKQEDCFVSRILESVLRLKSTKQDLC